MKTIKSSIFFKLVAIFATTAFLSSSIILPPRAQAQGVAGLTKPGVMVPPSPAFQPAMMRGITLDLANPFSFDFLIHPGESDLTGDALRDETTKLIKYFMAALTVPEEEMWVNLSPYEEGRIISQGFGDTEMGRDLLAQDYMLKQLTASLIYPENELGSEFWERVYNKAQERYGTTEIPMNTFNKVWIVPERAVIYEKGTTAVVIESHLKVLLDEDYLALEANVGSTKHGLGDVTKDDLKVVSGVTSDVVREIIIPEIEKEVNQGKTFANLRQITNSVILATWYKNKIRNSILNQVYIDQNKTKGVDTSDKEVNQKIYEQYVEAFKKGVFNFIKEDYDERTQEYIPRKYFSGGVVQRWTNKTDLASENQLASRREAEDVLDGAFSAKARMKSIGVDLSTESPSPNPTLEELETKMFAVHATPVLPQGEFLIAGAADDSNAWRDHENLAPHFRPTIHFALGEMINGNDRDRNYPYAVVTPLGNIAKQVVNIFPTDTFVVGNVKLSENTILVVPEGTNTENLPDDVPIFQYGKDKKLRDAINDVINEQGGWRVQLPDEFHPGLPATIGEVDINSTDFFQPMFDQYPHISFGTHIGSEVGMAGLFGSIDFFSGTMTAPYLLRSPAFDTDTTEIMYEILKTNLRKLDQFIEANNFPEEALEGYRAKRLELREWMNVVEVDLEIRKSTRRMVADPIREVSQIIRRNRSNKDRLRTLMVENLTKLRFSFGQYVRRGEGLPLRYATYFEVYTPSEIEQSKRDNPVLAKLMNDPQFKFRYAIERWLSVKSEKARAEGLDSILEGAVAEVSDDSSFDGLNVISKLIIEGGGMTEGNNRLETAFEILRMPAVRDYLRDRYQISFGEGGPNTLEDVLRAHPETKDFYLEFQKPSIEDEEFVKEFLQKTDFLYSLNEVQEARSFEEVKEFVSRRESYWEDLEKDAKIMRAKKLNETVHPDDIVGRMPSFYEVFRTYYDPAEKFEAVGLRSQFEETFGTGEEGKDAFWNTDKTLLEVYRDLRRAAGLSDLSSENPGGIDLNPSHMNMKTQGESATIQFPIHDFNLPVTPVEGFTPVIINITPITNIPLLLGEAQQPMKNQLNLSRR